MKKAARQDKLREMWAEVEHEVGIPMTAVTRERFAKEKRGCTFDTKVDKKDMHDDALRIASYIKDRLIESTPKEKPTSECDHYRKSYEKQMCLLDFIVAHHVQQHPEPADIYRGKRKQYAWKAISRAWNKNHPDNPYSPDNMRSAFYGIIKALPGEYELTWDENLFWPLLMFASRQSKEHREKVLDILAIMTCLKNKPRGYSPTPEENAFVELVFKFNQSSKEQMAFEDVMEIYDPELLNRYKKEMDKLEADNERLHSETG